MSASPSFQSSWKSFVSQFTQALSTTLISDEATTNNKTPGVHQDLVTNVPFIVGVCFAATFSEAPLPQLSVPGEPRNKKMSPR
jgi:hypothetical protein